MLYAILCYNQEDVIAKWSPEHDAAVMARHHEVLQSVAAKGKLGPVARLQATRTASTLREKVVLDGPFAETKEQLLGFYIVDCATLEEAQKLASQLADPPGCTEVRPVHSFWPSNIST